MRQILIAFALLIAAAGPARAAINLSPAERQDVQRVEQYLTGLRTMESRFLQATSNGNLAKGKLYVKRPGRLRFEYDPPVPVLIVADGRHLIYYDSEAEQTSYLPIDSTAAAFLLQDPVRLSGSVDITDFQRTGAGLRITLVQADEPEAGSVTLYFADNPLRLEQWVVLDAQGIETRISLVDPQRGVSIDSSKFVFIERDPFGRQDR